MSIAECAPPSAGAASRRAPRPSGASINEAAHDAASGRVIPVGDEPARARAYDLVVIGTAQRRRLPPIVAALRAGAVIDHLPFGGTCALRGCDSKKVLVGAAETLDQAHRLRNKGIGGGEPAICWRALMAAVAREQKLHFRIRHEKTSAWYTARRIAEDCAGFKVLIEEGTERILGAHLIGPHEEEAINIFALTIRTGLSANHLKERIFGYRRLPRTSAICFSGNKSLTLPR